jgi:L-ascorbate metabolism protein UlaG (beta-lactamase superfamily)
MSIRIRWLGTACFEIVLPSGKTMVLDPYMDDAYSAPIRSDEIEGCDYIFITHGHFDHITDVGKLSERFGPKIFCSDTTANALIAHQGVDPGAFTTVHVGDVVAEADLTVEVVKGVHVDLSKLAIPSAKKETVRIPADVDFSFEKLGEWMKNYPGGEQLNFIFDPTGGKRIYMAGTYPDPSLVKVAEKANADITLLQVMSGSILSGLEEQTLEMARASGCKILIPQHHDPLMPGSPKTNLTRLRQLVAETTDMEFRELEPGKWYRFD